LDSHVNLSNRIRSLEKHSPLISVLNATLYTLFSARRRGRKLKKKQRNAAGFLGSILHHTNSFSML